MSSSYATKSSKKIKREKQEKASAVFKRLHLLATAHSPAFVEEEREKDNAKTRPAMTVLLFTARNGLPHVDTNYPANILNKNEGLVCYCTF